MQDFLLRLARRGQASSPPGAHRTPERLRYHYEVERELAARLRNSTREERPTLSGELYDELFRRVTDHPLHSRKKSEAEHERVVRGQIRLLGPFLQPGVTVVEFAPGNCWLAYEAAKTAAQVIGVDISDQSDKGRPAPPNFKHVVYDGYALDLPDKVADVVYSYQFLEHLHPDDVGPHFDLANRLLKPGGVYVFDTPHRYSGPHDISRDFSDRLDCFHFQEWTHRDMRKLLAAHGFSTAWVFRFGRTFAQPAVNPLVDTVELMLAPLPQNLRRSLFSRVFPSVAMVARKD